jgi:hypothetical protein
MPGIRPNKLIQELSREANRSKIFYARLAEPYDGIGQHVLIDLSKGSVASVYKARVAAGDFNSGRTFPIGTQVSVHISRGHLEILSLGPGRSEAVPAAAVSQLALCDLHTNLVAGLTDESLKASDAGGGLEKSQAVDGLNSTRWSPPNGQGPTPDHWWAADLSSSKTAGAFRYFLSFAQDLATAGSIYGSDSSSAWSWLPVGKIVADPTANGWTLVTGWTDLVADENGEGDTGLRDFAAATYRYWLVRATAGGATSSNEFDISEFELWSNPRSGIEASAARCDHGHSAGEVYYSNSSSGLAALDVQEALDEVAEGSWKRPVRVATTTAGTLATSFEAGDSVDGVTLVAGDRLLIKNQTAGAENGIYVVAATEAPTRAKDFDASANVLGATMFVSEGTINSNKVFICTTNAPITLDTTALVFATPSLVSGLEVFLVASVGVKGYIRVPFTCYIVRVTLLANASGNMVVDIWNDTYANFPPTVADTICAAAKPTLSTAQKYEDTTLTGWNRNLTEGSVLGFNVDSASGLIDANLELQVTRDL